MKVIIAGPRGFKPMDSHITRVVAETGWSITEVVCGGAPGVDEAGKQWAERRGIPVKVVEANWNAHGKAAGPIRNEKMAKYADAAILIFAEEPTPGTCNMLGWMVVSRKPYHCEVP